MRYGLVHLGDGMVLEGARSGTRAVLVRFSGCNLWDGHPLHRDQGGSCARWCDSDHYAGRILSLEEVFALAEQAWPKDESQARWMHLTGGEPFAQLDRAFVDEARARGWLLSAETNGTLKSKLYPDITHLVVSPKKGHALVDGLYADELRVTFPCDWEDAELPALAALLGAPARYVVPMDPPSPEEVGITFLRGMDGESEDQENFRLVAATLYESALKRAYTFVQANPDWRLSIQAAKIAGLE